jgi:rare lipoprotein A
MALLGAASLAWGGSAVAAPAAKRPAAASTPGLETGIASIYCFRSGRTASGERARPFILTAAHKTLPFGTLVEVTNHRNGRSIVVRINDRGPFIKGRIIDLTPAGARALKFDGLTPVTVRVLNARRDERIVARAF